MIPGIVPAGGCCPSQTNANIALTGTSKNTTRDTTAGETRFNVKLNKVWPRNCAPIINPASSSHCVAGYPVKFELVKSTTGKIKIAHVE